MAERIDPDYRSLFEQLPGSFLVVRADPAFTIVEANDAYLQATFTTRESIVGRGLFDVLPKEPVATRGPAGAKLRRSLENVIATGRRDPMPVQRFDVLRPAAEGGGSVERFWSAVNAPVCGPDGELLYIVHSIEDVTEFVLSSRAMQTDDDALRLEILHRGRQLAATNKQLREVVSQFRAIYDQGVFAGRVDVDGKLIDANRPSLEQCGYTAIEVVGKPFWECGWWNRSAEVQAWVKNAIEHSIRGESFRGISIYFLSDGTERITDFACMPIKDDSGKVLFVFTTGIDITERVSAERNLHAMQILESITQGFFALDPEWRFTYVNREAQRILARPPNELIGKSIWTEYPGLRGSEFEAAFHKVVAGRGPSTVTARYAEHGRWYDMQVYPAAEGIAVYFRDVTNQVEAQAERERLTAESERQRAMYEAALSNTPDLVYVVDANQRFMYANEALLKMLGKSREDLVGKDCLELGYPPWHAQMHSREIEHVLSTRLTVRSEVPFVGPEGRRVYDYILVPVLARDGTVAAVAGTARDITHRKAAEQAIREHAEALRQADRAKDEFLATLAHELRNPLAPLRSALHLLRDSRGADDSTASLIELMERQLDHLIRLVDDLLEMSRITRGTFTLRKELIALTDVVRNAIETSKPLIEAAQHSLSVTLPEEPLWLEGDPVRLAQVVANLLNNAARYTEDRGRISVVAERRGNTAEISVVDTGIGISPEALPRVFEMFERGTESAAGGGGLGIGLSLAQRLAAMHGGSIEAHSAGPGKGSRFVVRLPLAAAPGTERRTVERTAGSSVKPPSSTRILVVDDNRDAAVTLAMILKSFGAETETACSGPEALEKFDEWRPSIVFLDIGMPRMDGYEVARRIREDHPDRRPTLVALTGWGQREDKRKARDAGFDRHIVKPAEIGVLEDIVMSSSSRGTSIA